MKQRRCELRHRGERRAWSFIYTMQAKNDREEQLI